MQNYIAPENAVWLEPALVVAVGATVIVGLAAWADRFVRRPIWQRTLWQVATLGLLALMLVEWTGTAPALVCLWRTRVEPVPPGPKAAAGPEDEQPRSALSNLLAREDCGLPEEQESPSLGARFAEASWAATAASDEDARDHELGYVAWRAVALEEEPDSISERALEERAGGALPGGGQGIVREETPVEQPAVSLATWWLGAIWMFGAIAITARTVCAWGLLLAFRRRHAEVSDGTLRKRVGGLARRLGIRRTVCVLEASGLSTPVAFGSLRPTVALPVTFSEEFDRQQQNAVLAHELAHLAARDPAWQFLASLLCAALWWHPVVWCLRCRLRAASEAAADEASLLVPDGPDLLAACLVAMGRRLVPAARLGWMPIEGLGFRSGLGRRVERLLNLPGRSWRAPGRSRLLLARTTLPVVLMIVAVCCTAWVRPQATFQREGGTTMNVLRISWRRSLAASALALFATGCSSAVADDPPPQDSSPAVVDGHLVALAEGEEVAARDREEREREEVETRERGEREREQVEVREREEREREEIETRERGEREREQVEVREREEREREEVETRERGEREREQVEVREREEREREEVQRRERHEFGTNRERLVREFRELQQRAEHLRHEREGLRDGQDAAARELQGALREVEERMVAIRRELGDPQRDRERDGDRRDGDRRDVDRRDVDRRDVDRRPDQPRPETRGNLEPQVRELRNEVRQLRREVQELREILGRLLGRETREGEAREGERRERREGEAREGEGRERREGEAREGEERERREGEAREGEGRERKEGEARKGEGRERKEGEAREGEGRERKEGEEKEGEQG